VARSKNVVIALSGGASPVINNSLRGIVEICRATPDHFDTVYGARHGIQGILTEDLLDLSAQDDEEIALLRSTPASGAIGTCRYKLRQELEEDFERIVEVIKTHNVGHLFFIGGNDSMDTAHKLSQLADERGLDLHVTGVPKTIDNDIGDCEFQLIDHTPGYGSAARYWAITVRNANQENAGSAQFGPVIVYQAMGRRIGFIPAAARLADPNREMPLLIILCEAGLTLEELSDLVNDTLRIHGRAIVIISEGFDVGEIGGEKDAFGHTIFAASKINVAQVVMNHLNRVGLAVRGVVRSNIPGTDQHQNIMYASTVDMEEAYQVGRHAAMMAMHEESGYMATILRDLGPVYRVRYDKVPLQAVANSERALPKSWLAPSRADVTDDFVRYARPLIGDDWPSVPLIDGLQRFTRFKPIFAEKRLEDYVPQAYRTPLT
jgi:6-phosphofructokinase